VCGRYTLRHSLAAFGKRWGWPVPGVEPTWNQHPGARVLTLRASPESADQARFQFIEWGYRDQWMDAPGARVRGPLKNAKAEHASRAGSYSSVGLQHRRCIVLADGWYEWPSRGAKDPHFIRFRDDRIFGFAAIWANYRPPDSSAPVRDTLAIITTAANELVRRVPHHRMPVIVGQGDWAAWLSPRTAGKDIVRHLEPWLAKDLEMWRVDRWVNNATNNSPRAIAPAGPIMRSDVPAF
jgi:putative SOS response-associated peptidase YedK